MNLGRIKNALYAICNLNWIYSLDYKLWKIYHQRTIRIVQYPLVKRERCKLIIRVRLGQVKLTRSIFLLWIRNFNAGWMLSVELSRITYCSDKFIHIIWVKHIMRVPNALNRSFELATIWVKFDGFMNIANYSKWPRLFNIVCVYKTI